MKLWEIDNALMELFDPETGEIVDAEQWEALQMEREKKLEGVACWVKNLLSHADAIKAEKDETAKRIFKGMVTSFEESNQGYVWNWDESSLVQKTVGILFRNEEWKWEGKTGWNVKPIRCMSAGKVRSGDYTLPKDKPLRGDAYDTGYSYPASSAVMTAVETDDLPF